MWHEYEHLRNVFSRARFGFGKKYLNGCRTRAGLGYYSVGRGAGSDRKIRPDPCSNTHTHTHTHTYTHTHTHTHTNTYTHTHTHANTYTHTHTHTCTDTLIKLEY